MLAQQSGKKVREMKGKKLQSMNNRKRALQKQKFTDVTDGRAARKKKFLVSCLLNWLIERFSKT